jgi:hypothetical protein
MQSMDDGEGISVKVSKVSQAFVKWILSSTLPSIMFLLFLSSTSQAQVLPYLDKQFPCLNQDQANKYKQDFNVDLKTFGGPELCNPQVDFKKLTNDLGIIEYGQFIPGPSQGLIGQFVDSSKYYLWMRAQTRGMERGNDIPTATAYNRGGYFTMQDGWTRLSTLGRVGTVIHEARHTEGYRHVPCTYGPYAGVRMDGCDKDLSYGGSHAVEMEYYARVSIYGKNFHPVYRTMARLMAMARSNFVFNSSPLQKREGLLVQTDAGNFWLLDGNKWILRSPITPQALGRNLFRDNASIPGLLKRTSFGATLFNGLNAFAIDLYERYEPSNALTDTYSYFKILLDLKTNLRDYEEFDLGIKRHLVQVSLQNQTSSFNFGQGKWNAPKALSFQPSLSSTTLPSGETGYFLVDNQGNIYSYNTNKDEMNLSNHKWDPQALNYVKVNSQVFSVSRENKLFYLNNSTWSEVQVPQNQKAVQIASVPLYNIFAVKE